ncbi:MAG: glucokinase [Xanthomonadales bacterium]|jgi:glucokinase|nr:glucokinase [Xanthomonadales bacterium]MDH3924189.1 glucokinase [Xanthomonadales bacterium]MDH3940078.1 glucokinase [Xanthomonadales bacterium]MDH3999973.1 glucokinase [Xanthomonadales bacterium]
MTEYKILAADIGGTNARFAEVRISGLSRISMSEPVVFPTWSEDIDSFNRLLEHYAESLPAGSAALQEFDALAIAIAGAVNGQRGTLPNIAWDIDLTVSQPVRRAFLLNDFSAQAHAYLEKDVFERLRLVRPGPGPGPGSIAIVGAGTGLGHAALKRYKGERVVIGSEAGHTSFSFHSKREREIESKMLARKGQAWLTGDDVVSGSGAALIHESLTGISLSPAQALAAGQKASETCKYYARFYARACRNYCLSMFPVEALVISGGIAAKNPHLVESDAFFDEFNDARSYRHLLERIPIYLNQDELLGIKGAAIHAWQELIH